MTEVLTTTPSSGLFGRWGDECTNNRRLIKAGDKMIVPGNDADEWIAVCHEVESLPPAPDGGKEVNRE